MDLVSMLNPVELPGRPECCSPMESPRPEHDADAAEVLLLLGALAPPSATKAASVRLPPVTTSMPLATSTQPYSTLNSANMRPRGPRRSPRILPLPSPGYHLSPIAQHQKQARLSAAAWKENGCFREQPLPSMLSMAMAMSMPMSMPMTMPGRTILDQQPTSASSRPLVPVGAIPAPATNTPTATCSVVGCHRAVAHHRKCALHKCMKFCQIEGCTRPVQSRGVCKSHGGGARCKYPGCTKGAISKNRCRTHGGGTRCAIPDCLKWAQRFGYCVRHSKHMVLAAAAK